MYTTCGLQGRYLTRLNIPLLLHLQDFLIRLGIMRGNKQPFTILDNISGTLKPVCTRAHC